jgi:hypothetical protein
MTKFLHLFSPRMSRDSYKNSTLYTDTMKVLSEARKCSIILQDNVEMLLYAFKFINALNLYNRWCNGSDIGVAIRL